MTQRIREDLITVAAKAGESVWVHAKGDPALLVAGVVVAASVVAAYGACLYGRRFLRFDAE